MLSNFSPEEYINKKVKILFEPMVTQILVEKPKDPVSLIFILDSIHD